MTCIAGLIHDGKVYVCADSAGVCKYDLEIRKDRKVFVNGDFVIGFTSSFRMGQILQFAFNPPKRHPEKSVMAYMVTDFVNAVRGALKDGGYARKESEQESAGDFLVGYAGRLFSIRNDYQVAENVSGFDSVGCGESYAKGVLFATEGQDPLTRLTLALKCAEQHSAGVRGPFYTEQI
jgi:hypothetical protein